MQMNIYDMIKWKIINKHRRLDWNDTNDFHTRKNITEKEKPSVKNPRTET